MSSAKTKKTSELPFEEAMNRLENLVSGLEKGETSLDLALDHFEEGMKLAKHCEELLDKAGARVEKVMRDFSGEEKILPVTAAELPLSAEDLGDDDEL